VALRRLAWDRRTTGLYCVPMSLDSDRTASLMTPARLAQLKARPAAAASPAAWLDQLASDAGSGHVRRLLDLRRQLEAQLAGTDEAALASAAAALAAALGQLDFALLQPKGWLARATGKARDAATGFAAQVERCTAAGDALTDAGRQLQRRQHSQAAAADRTLLEIEVELHALDRIVDQGARWLQDMRSQLKTREAAGGDAATLHKVQEDGRRCELLVDRLKRLRVATGAVQDALRQCRGASARRSSVAEGTQQVLSASWPATGRQLTTFAQTAAAGAADDLQAARTGAARLAATLEQLAADAQALQAQQQAAAAAVSALQAPLRACA
jgi:chromosome segregation ATPase